jgi:hypothetical protein
VYVTNKERELMYCLECNSEAVVLEHNPENGKWFPTPFPCPDECKCHIFVCYECGSDNIKEKDND